MINVFNIIYDKCVQAISDANLDVDMSSIYTDTPEALPHCSIIEQDNAVYRPGISLDKRENFAQIMLQVDVYSAEVSTRRSVCENILSVIDGCLEGLGFVRQTKMPMPNYDRGIYRITARYVGVVSKGITSGEDTVYLVYTP